MYSSSFLLHQRDQSPYGNAEAVPYKTGYNLLAVLFHIGFYLTEEILNHVLFFQIKIMTLISFASAIINNTCFISALALYKETKTKLIWSC